MKTYLEEMIATKRRLRKEKDRDEKLIKTKKQSFKIITARKL